MPVQRFGILLVYQKTALKPAREFGAQSMAREESGGRSDPRAVFQTSGIMALHRARCGDRNAWLTLFTIPRAIKLPRRPRSPLPRLDEPDQPIMASLS
jgi:hypothetical protein